MAEGLRRVLGRQGLSQVEIIELHERDNNAELMVSVTDAPGKLVAPCTLDKVVWAGHSGTPAVGLEPQRNMPSH